MPRSYSNAKAAAGGAGGIGNVVGPGSAVSGHLAVFNGTTGKIIADGGAVPTSITNSAGADVLPKTVDGSGNLGTSRFLDELAGITIGDGNGALQIDGAGGSIGAFLQGAPTGMEFNDATGFVKLHASILNVGALPTSDPASAGQLWNNLGVVMRSNG